MRILKIAGLTIIAYAIIGLIKLGSYTTVPIVEVDSATDEIVVEYRDHLYAAYVDDASEYEVGESVKVLMKSALYWDFSLSPTLDEITDIKQEDKTMDNFYTSDILEIIENTVEINDDENVYQ